MGSEPVEIEEAWMGKPGLGEGRMTAREGLGLTVGSP